VNVRRDVALALRQDLLTLARTHVRGALTSRELAARSEAVA
jgi:hypothetical protein